MPWKATSIVEQRIKFIAAWLEDEEAFTLLCERFGIARSKGYKWVDRYNEGGLEALHDRSRRPHSNSRSVPRSTIEALLVLRRRHPTWGPRKLLAILAREFPELELPAPSTVGEILSREGLTAPRRRHRKRTNDGLPLASYDAPNAIWCADFKGWFPIGSLKCNPLTISDGFSRYLLRCTAMRRTLHAQVKRGFDAAFREFGLPLAIRTDNGPPFVSVSIGGLSRLAIWWIKLGIRPERIMPGRPDQNGRHERMHRTLGAETTRPPQGSFAAQQRVFDKFRNEYNDVRPHEALGQRTPSTVYRASKRRYPSALEDPTYPKHFALHRPYTNGVISVDRTQWILTNNLANELVGLEPIEDGCWRVHFGPLPLGLIDLRRSVTRNARNFGMLLPLPEHPRRHNRRNRRTYR